MRLRYGILFILLVMVALALSGCSGTNTSATPTPTPKPGDGGYTVGTPTPATPGAGSPTTISDLYRSFSWLEYTTTSNVAGQTMTSTMKVEMLGREMHEGKMMEHMRTTINGNAQDYWYDPNAPKETNTTSFAQSAVPVTRIGPDTVTIGTKTYACTKYTATLGGETPMTYTYWVSPEAPAPVQYVTTIAGSTSTSQLTGWG